MKWRIDKTTGEHQLIVEGGFYAVISTAVGDWYAGFQSDESYCLDEDTIEYFDTWQAARKYCEKLAP